MDSLLQWWHTLSPPARFGLVGSGLALLLFWNTLPHQPALPPTASQRARHPRGVTQVDYRSLYPSALSGVPQTSYAQAVAMLGEGSLLHVSTDGRTRTYQWNGGGRWARLEATFRDGYVISKRAFALRAY